MLLLLSRRRTATTRASTPPRILPTYSRASPPTRGRAPPALQARGLSPLSHIGGWSHPFTVAGSVAFSDNTQGAKRALLVHIAPERNWTLRLTRAVAADVERMFVSDVSVVSPLPAPPHLEHLAHSVMMGGRFFSSARAQA